MPPHTPDAKAPLRAAIRRRRRQLPPAAHHQATTGLARPNAIHHLVDLAHAANTSAIASYAAIPYQEPDLTELHHALHTAGLSVLLPRTLPARRMEWVSNPTQVTMRTQYPRVPEPVGPPQPKTLWDHTQVVLVPALAADPTGNRLGQGGGYYDTLLADRPRQAHIVAVIFDEDLLPAGQVPTGPHDATVTAILTPTTLVNTPSTVTPTTGQ